MLLNSLFAKYPLSAQGLEKACFGPRAISHQPFGTSAAETHFSSPARAEVSF